MLSVDQSHGLKHILDVFDRYPWKFQYEKRHEIKNCLENLWHIDTIMKDIDRDIVFEMRNADPEHPKDFLKAASVIVPRIVYLMEKEDKEITRLNHAFAVHHADEVRADKGEIEEEEESEESYAKKLERWAKRMIQTTKKMQILLIVFILNFLRN